MPIRNGKTSHTSAELQAGTPLDAQNMDECNVPDLGTSGRDFTFFTSDTTTPNDGENTIEETGENGRWRAETVSSIVASALDVVHPLVFENTDSDAINIAIAGVQLGRRYVVSPATANALPVGVKVTIDQDNADGSLDFIITNNSGEDFAAGTISVNVYQA